MDALRRASAFGDKRMSLSVVRLHWPAIAHDALLVDRCAAKELPATRTPWHAPHVRRRQCPARLVVPDLVIEDGGSESDGTPGSIYEELGRTPYAEGSGRQIVVLRRLDPRPGGLLRNRLPRSGCWRCRWLAVHRRTLKTVHSVLELRRCAPGRDKRSESRRRRRYDSTHRRLAPDQGRPYARARGGHS